MEWYKKFSKELLEATLLLEVDYLVSLWNIFSRRNKLPYYVFSIMSDNDLTNLVKVSSWNDIKKITSFMTYGCKYFTFSNKEVVALEDCMVKEMISQFWDYFFDDILVNQVDYDLLQSFTLYEGDDEGTSYVMSYLDYVFDPTLNSILKEP